MWKSSIAFAQETAPGAPGAAPPGPNLMSTVIFMVIIFAVMWLFIILPNQRRDRRRKDMLSTLSKGDKVVTSGGICGSIVGLNDKTVVLKVSDDPVTKIEFARGAISQVSSQSDEGAEK